MSKHLRTLGLALLLCIGVVGAGAFYLRNKVKAGHNTTFMLGSNGSFSSHACSAQDEISENIEGLSRETLEVANPANRLVAVANRSAECRAEVIEATVRAMNKPDVILADRATFCLWSNGSYVLGSLKAVEALDFLIDHLDLNDGHFSASMSDQPLISGVIRMGPVAVPKLHDALTHKERRTVRLSVVLCLNNIGGQEATDALKQSSNYRI